MATLFLPWEHYPSLTEKRLSTIANLLQATRDHVVEISEPDEGDSTWSIGCRVYDRTIFQLRAASIGSSWLRVLPETQRLRLTFAIGEIAVKLYKGEPDDVPQRTLARSYSELHQMRLAFEREGADVNLSIRIAVETDVSGRTTAISLVEVNEEGDPIRVYGIPLTQANIIPMKVAAIELAAPKLELIKPVKEKEVADVPQTSVAGSKP